MTPELEAHRRLFHTAGYELLVYCSITIYQHLVVSQEIFQHFHFDPLKLFND
jgi:hypothetical protein